MIQEVDYRKIHRLAGKLFEPLKSEVERQSCMLSDLQVAEFAERGFLRGPKVLSDRQIDVLRDGLEKIRRGTNPRLRELYEIDEDSIREPEKNVFHILGAWMIDEAFHDVLFHPKIAIPISQLLGSPQVRFWHDQVFYKPANHPGVVTWHQDYSYWTRSMPARHVTVWIGLDDSTLENGCVQFVPGSHKWDLLPKVSLTKDMNAITTVMTPEQLAAFKPEPMILKAGECSFHHSHTLHGSYGNGSSIPRRAVVLNFMHPQTRSADGTSPLLVHTPIVPEGAIIEGDHYPIVYDSAQPLTSDN